MARLPGFLGPTYRAANPIADSERAINCYASPIESAGGIARGVLSLSPGYSTFLTVDGFPGRGIFAQNGRCFCVAGANLYELYTDGTSEARGTGLTNDGSPALISSNGEGGEQLWITSGSKGYVYDLSANTLTQVLDPGNFSGFCDGYFVSLDIAASQLRISNLLDGTTWDAGDYAQRSLAGDSWKALVVAHRNLWLFGSQTTEVWYNDGGTFPFTPIPGALFAHGCAAAYSVALVDNAPVWLASSVDGTAIVVRGGLDGVRRISTHALEHAIQNYGTISDAIGWTYQERGHNVYVLTFPTAGKTWEYHANTGFWNERGYWNLGAFEESRARYHAFAFGRHLVQDRVTGAVYTLSAETATDVGGYGMRWVRQTPPLFGDGPRVFVRALELVMETGVGAASGVGSDPTVMLRVSRDGGRTFGPEITASAGTIGAYLTRVRWTRLGCGRHLVFEVSGSDPVVWRIVDALIEAQPGTS